MAGEPALSRAGDVDGRLSTAAIIVAGLVEDVELVKAYLRSLPRGLDSYPETTVKVSVVEAFAAGHDRAALAEAVPPALTDLARGQVAVTQWIPEAHATVLYLTIRALFYDSDDAFVADALARNRRLMRSRLYGVLVRLLSPARLHKGSRMFFRQVHRGIELSVLTDAVPPRWILEFPPHLVPPLLARCYATAARAALLLSQGLETTATIVEHSDTRLVLEIRPASSS